MPAGGPLRLQPNKISQYEILMYYALIARQFKVDSVIPEKVSP
jgi:hypothetical protein